MPVKKLPYKPLDELIKKNLIKEEDFVTKTLIKCLRDANIRGWLLKSELISICRWKSARAINYIKSNHPNTIKKHTTKAFNSKSEQLKIQELTKLKGVSIPMASAILMLINPKRYGVIDIRVWEVMYEIGNVKTNPKGVNFKFKEWYQLLMHLRFFSKKYKVSVRNIERTIFMVHKNNQDGLLYKNVATTKN